MMKTVPWKFSGRWRPVILSVAFVTTTVLSYAGSFSLDPTVVVVTKNLNSRKHKIRLFTAADAKTILFTVDGVDGKPYTLFVFDLDGKLVTQSAIRNHQTGILPVISSGDYLYEVFVEDSKVETGQLTIR